MKIPNDVLNYEKLESQELRKIGRSAATLTKLRMLNAPEVILLHSVRLVWERTWRVLRIQKRLEAARDMREAFASN